MRETAESSSIWGLRPQSNSLLSVAHSLAMPVMVQWKQMRTILQQQQQQLEGNLFNYIATELRSSLLCLRTQF